MSILLLFLLLAGSSNTLAFLSLPRSIERIFNIIRGDTVNTITDSRFVCPANAGAEPITAGQYENHVGSMNLNLRTDTVTMSGHSSGGMMTHQFHLANSAMLSGVGVFSGVPYKAFYIEGGLWGGTTDLGQPDGATLPFARNRPRPDNPESNLQQATADMQAGKLDDFSNLDGQKVYVYHGGDDRVISFEHGKNLVEFYNQLADANSINIDVQTQLDNQTGIGHGVPTLISTNTKCNVHDIPCMATALSPFRYCPYSAVQELFQHLYGDPTPNPNYSGGSLYNFNQARFLPATDTHSMDNVAKVYVPNRCKHEACHFHVSIHGCMNTAHWPGAHMYFDSVEYKQLADTYGIVILFPQTMSKLFNLYACWNVDGYPVINPFKTSANSDYPTKTGEQIQALKSMIEAILANDF